MERLTREDQILLWPDERWPQEVGAVAVLDATALLDPDGDLRLERLKTLIKARLHKVPRLRQLLYVPPWPFGAPLWIDDPNFDIDEHVWLAAVSAPGGDIELLAAVEQIMAERLDRSRPLWQMWLLPGLSGDRIGLFLRLHHVVADGIAAISTFGELLDPVSDRAIPVPPTWAPRPRPGRAELLLDNLRQQARRGRSAVVGLRHPRAAGRTAGTGWRSLRSLLVAEPHPGTSLDRPVGPARRLALLRVELDRVRTVAHAHDATVNDVLLTIVAGGVRGLLEARGESMSQRDLPVYVPKTLRREALAPARGNLIGQLVVPTPVGVSDPVERLRRIAAETARLKAASVPSIGNLLGNRLARRLLLVILHRHPVSVTTADLVGPAHRLHLAGAEIREVFPVLPLIGNVTVGVAALSYAGTLGVTFVVDRDAVPDCEELVRGVAADLGALLGDVPAGDRAAQGRGEAS